jgi:hypothetical protein
MSEIHRRRFLATAGLAATAATQASGGEGPARPAPFRIDCRSHLFCPDILALLAKRKTDPVLETRGGERWVRMGDWNRRVLPNHSDVDATKWGLTPWERAKDLWKNGGFRQRRKGSDPIS